MGISDAAKAAREKADTSTNPADHALANALEAAEAAAFDAIRRAETPPADIEGIPPPPITTILIPKSEKMK